MSDETQMKVTPAVIARPARQSILSPRTTQNNHQISL
jgi:hypothetical protein